MTVILFISFIFGTSSVKAATPHLHPNYDCQGLPYDGSTANNVCHGLAITRHSYTASVPTNFDGGGAQMSINYMGCAISPCNISWITNEVKIADDNGNWVEGGLFYGYRKIDPSYFFPESLYWSDSRPQDSNDANYHILAAVTSGMIGSNLQIDIARSHNINDYSWFVNLYAPGVTYNNGVLDSTPNTFNPTNVQMGEFLIGSSINGTLFSDGTKFASRYYLDQNFNSTGIYGNYQVFADNPPYEYGSGTGGDFVVYCCTTSVPHAVVTAQPSQVVSDTMSSTPVMTTPVGIPAVQHDQSKGATAAAAGQGITADDVTNYVQSGMMPMTVNAKDAPHVLHARLMTAKQVSAQLQGESTGFPADKMLWFADVSGTFNFPEAKGVKDSCHHGYEVFDPTTGNLLMFGGMQ